MNRIGASRKVHDYIVERIQSQKWKPDDRILTENEFTQILGVSRVAVRQALDRLSAVGLLTKRQGSGTFVANRNAEAVINSLIPIILIEKKELLSLLEFRVYFETGNIDLFMRNCEPKWIEELERHFEMMTANQENPEVFYTEDFNFHMVIARGTRNPFIIRISEILNDVLLSHQAHLYENIGPEVGLKFHTSLLEAIKANDREMAVLLMKRHIRATIDAVKTAQDKTEAQ